MTAIIKKNGGESVRDTIIPDAGRACEGVACKERPAGTRGGESVRRHRVAMNITSQCTCTPPLAFTQLPHHLQALALGCSRSDKTHPATSSSCGQQSIHGVDPG